MFGIWKQGRRTSSESGIGSQRHRHYLRSLFIILLITAFSRPVFSAPICAVPGNDGPGAPSGVINTYYPGTASVSAGAASIPVGFPSGDFSNLITTGDLLLVIQMQDADINTSNNSSYGGSGSGSGYTSLNQAGVYEYVTAAGPVSGGYVPISGNLTNSYRSRAASASNGQSTFQVIRVPQYSTATVSGTVSALPWNGTVGGVVAMDVAGTLTINGEITANGAGFRGGWGESSNATGPDTDYRTSATVLGNGMKGEGIAGTPNRMNQPTSFDGAPNQSTSGTSLGYPGGANNDAAKGRGAPGNAGGGGTDGNTANDENSGGGGGGNFAAGAKGGNSWNSNLPVGGEGGSGVTGLAFNRVVMGGGGGAGTTNNGTADSAIYFTPAGLSCTAGAGACSSGAPGGGIILLRANSLAGSGMVTANGGSGYNVLNDSAGGGGAGGSVVIDTQAGGSLTVYANGGDGGNAWRSHTTLIDRHGPGGGGSGGFVAYSPATGFSVSATVNGGTSGRSCNNDAYGSTSSSGGIYTFQSPNAAGPLPGASCVPNLSTSTKTVVDLNGGDYSAGDVLQYTITLNETNGFAASGVSVTDPIDANLTNFSVVSFPAGATDSSTAALLNISGITVPANGSVSVVFNATISGSATPGTTIPNTATVTTPLGNGATPFAPVITVTFPAGTGNKPLYLNSAPAIMSRTQPAGVPATVTIGTNASQVWNQLPLAQGDITIDPSISGGFVPVVLQAARSGSSGNISLTVRLQCSSGGTTLTRTQNCSAGSTPATRTCTYNLPLAAPLTCASGNAWRLTVLNNSDTRTLYIHPVSAGNFSRVVLPATTVIKVQNVDPYGVPFTAVPNTTQPATYPPGSQVYLRAVVTDPFGSFDINASNNATTQPKITVRDPGNNIVVNAQPMPQAADSGTATKTFEYAYTIPAGGASGVWSMNVTAPEGTEGTVSDTAGGTFRVLATPLLTIVKSATPSPAVNPGQVVTYTVLVTNTGQGAATDVVLTDSMSPYVAWGIAGFTFINGTPSSGLALGAPDYSQTNGTTWGYTPSNGGGGAPAGYDGTVTNWRIPMTGTMNANGANFTITYTVRVK